MAKRRELQLFVHGYLVASGAIPDALEGETPESLSTAVVFVIDDRRYLLHGSIEAIPGVFEKVEPS